MKLCYSRLYSQLLVVGVLFGLVPWSASAQIVGTVDGKMVVKKSSKSSMKQFIDSTVQNLKDQDVGDLMHPKSGKYYLTMASSVARVIVYINAEKKTIRWESRNEAVMKLSPENLPAIVLKSMMDQGILMTLASPSHEDYATALESELKKLNVDAIKPGDQKVCVKLGYQRCKLVLDFQSKEGMLIWGYQGSAFMPGNHAEAMLRILQARGAFKGAAETSLVIIQGDNAPAEEEEGTSGKSSPVASAAAKPKVEAKALSVSESAAIRKIETNSSSAKSQPAAPVVQTVKLDYDIAVDHSDYATEASAAIVVKGLKGGTGVGSGEGRGDGQGVDPFATYGNGNGNGGIGDGPGLGIGVAGIKTSLTAGVAACNSIQKSGGHGTTTVPMNFGSRKGKVHVIFTTYSITDEMIIRCNNHVMKNTGMMSGTVEFDFDYQPFGVGARANTCQIVVNGNEDTGTAWQFGASCPGKMFQGVFE